MINHQLLQDMLAVRGDLSAEQEGDVARHVEECTVCARIAAEFEQQDQALRTLRNAQPPATVRRGVMAEVERQSGPKVNQRWKRWSWLPGALALVASGVFLIGTVLWPRQATPARASVLATLRGLVAARGTFLPYRGSLVLSYDELPLPFPGSLPVRARAYSDRHQLVVRWAVQDVRHFRVDVTVQLPALQAGAVTYVRNGGELLIYDRRAGRAVTEDVSRLPPVQTGGGSISPDILLLSQLLNGGAIGGTALIDPTESVQAYLASLRSSPFDEPLHPPAYARVVGTASVLGRAAYVIDFGPLQRSDYITGCSFAHPGHCMHHPSGEGYERLWIDKTHPFVLALERHDGATPASVLFFGNARMRVTALTFGAGPTSEELHYRPPIAIHGGNGKNSAWSSGGVGEPGAVPTPFVALTPPSGHDEPQTAFFYSFLSGPAGTPAEYDQVWMAKSQSYGRAPSGPYVAGQEYVHVHGLPLPWRRGQKTQTGSCTTFSGTYADGQRWLATQIGAVSIVISSNALSRSDLVRYAEGSICRRVGQ